MQVPLDVCAVLCKLWARMRHQMDAIAWEFAATSGTNLLAYTGVARKKGTSVESKKEGIHPMPTMRFTIFSLIFSAGPMLLMQCPFYLYVQQHAEFFNWKIKRVFHSTSESTVELVISLGDHYVNVIIYDCLHEGLQ